MNVYANLKKIYSSFCLSALENTSLSYLNYEKSSCSVCRHFLKCQEEIVRHFFYLAVLPDSKGIKASVNLIDRLLHLCSSKKTSSTLQHKLYFLYSFLLPLGFHLSILYKSVQLIWADKEAQLYLSVLNKTFIICIYSTFTVLTGLEIMRYYFWKITNEPTPTNHTQQIIFL